MGGLGIVYLDLYFTLRFIASSTGWTKKKSTSPKSWCIEQEEAEVEVDVEEHSQQQTMYLYKCTSINVALCVCVCVCGDVRVRSSIFNALYYELAQKTKSAGVRY